MKSEIFTFRYQRASGTIPISADTSVGGSFTMIAGPCAVESEEQVMRIARRLRKSGVRFLRGGAFKPRTSPYAFQGLGDEGLRILRKVADELGMFVVTEIMDARDLSLFDKHHIDVMQVGARNMQNFTLLRELGHSSRPVLLKRGMGSSIDELLMASEYVLAGGNKKVILCERGIKTFETATRATLDLSAVPVLRERTKLPVIIDPSHAAGAPSIIPALMRAAVAVGADGLLVEVHDRPNDALCDGKQALSPVIFSKTIKDLRAIAGALKITLQ